MIRLRVAVGITFAAPLAFAGSGLAPQASTSAYQAHGDAEEATIAASTIPQNEVRKLFTSDVGKKYIVVEIAVYPKAGHNVEIHMLDFELKSASGEKSFTATPEEVAAIWGQKRPQLTNRAQVVGQESVEYNSMANPASGRVERGWGTDAGTGAGSAPPIYGSGPDRRKLEEKLRSCALPEGRTNRAIAGYMYFPVSKRRKDDVPELVFRSGGRSISLRLGR